MTVRAARAAHESFYQELTALLRKHADAGNLSSIEMLAIASNIVGKLVAFQDQRSVTPEKAMEIVANNVRLGNDQALASLGPHAGTA